MSAYFVFSEAHEPHSSVNTDLECKVCRDLGLVGAVQATFPQEPTPIDVPEPPIEPPEQPVVPSPEPELVTNSACIELAR